MKWYRTLLATSSLGSAATVSEGIGPVTLPPCLRPQIVTRASRIKAAATGQDYAATVTAMSRTLEALSRDMATTRQPMAPQAPTR